MPWYDSLDPNLNRKGLERFNSVEDLVRSYQNLHREYSRRVRMPDEDSSLEERNEFYSRVGLDVPGSPEGYKSVDDPVLNNLRQKAHAAGLTTKAWNTFVKTYADAQSSHQSMIKQQIDEWTNQTKTQYGEEFSDKIAAAERTLQTIYKDSPQLLEVLRAAGVDKHPAIQDLMLKVQEKIGPDKLPTSYASDNLSKPHQLRKAILEIDENPLMKSNIMSNTQNAKELKQKREALYKELVELGIDGINDPKFF